eukprot:1150037-Pelagomonas_calceolata.AAC.2
MYSLAPVQPYTSRVGNHQLTSPRIHDHKKGQVMTHIKYNVHMSNQSFAPVQPHTIHICDHQLTGSGIHGHSKGQVMAQMSGHQPQRTDAPHTHSQIVAGCGNQLFAHGHGCGHLDEQEQKPIGVQQGNKIIINILWHEHRSSLAVTNSLLYTAMDANIETQG